MPSPMDERLTRLWRDEAPAIPAYYRKVFSKRSNPGSAVLADLADFCFAMSGTTVPGDTHLTAENNGRRAVFLHIQAMMETDHKAIQNILDRIDHGYTREEIDPLDRG